MDAEGHDAKRPRVVSDDPVDLLSLLASAGANNPSGLSGTFARPPVDAPDRPGARREPGTAWESRGEASLSATDESLALSPRGMAGLMAAADGAGGASTVGRTGGGPRALDSEPGTSVASDAQHGHAHGRRKSSGGNSAGWVTQQQAAQQQQALEQQARLARGSAKRAPTDPKPKARRSSTDAPKVSGGASTVSPSGGDDEDDEGGTGDDRVRFQPCHSCLETAPKPLLPPLVA